MSQDQLSINGELLRLSREARGWVLNDLATRACMSVKQIRQLEEGGMSSFYSEAVKMTAAKKVGALLGLSAAEVFAQAEVGVKEEPAVTHILHAEHEHEQTVDSIQTQVDASIVEEQTSVSAVIDHEHGSTLDSSTDDHLLVNDSVAQEQEPKSKNSLWVIVGLFVAALAVAAYMQPQDEQVAEPAPPLQVVPSDAADAASASSASDAPASASAVEASSASAVATVSASASTSAPRIAATTASVAAPVVSRPASAPVAAPAVPNASAASKAL